MKKKKSVAEMTLLERYQWHRKHHGLLYMFHQMVGICSVYECLFYGGIVWHSAALMIIGIVSILAWFRVFTTLTIVVRRAANSSAFYNTLSKTNQQLCDFVKDLHDQGLQNKLDQQIAKVEAVSLLLAALCGMVIGFSYLVDSIWSVVIATIAGFVAGGGLAICICILGITIDQEEKNMPVWLRAKE